MATIFINQEDKPGKRYLDKGAMEKFMERKHAETNELKMKIVDRDLKISELTYSNGVQREENKILWVVIMLLVIVEVLLRIFYA